MFASLAALGPAGGCAVGPDFHPPTGPSLTALTPEPLGRPGRPSGGRPTFVQDLGIPQRWWGVLRCKPVDIVMTRALSDSAEIEAQAAALRAADADAGAAQGSLFPQLGASAQASRQKPNTVGAGAGASTSPYSVATGQLNISYVADVFGLNRRQIESKLAQAEVQAFQLEAALLTLSSRLALAAIAEASLRDQIAAMDATVAVAREVLAQVKQQLALREASKIDVAAQEVALAQFEQTVAGLRKRLATNRDLIIALTGHLAGEGLVERFEFRCFTQPQKRPLSLPGEIVQNRPDVRAAEAEVHAATADVGVAVANRLPQFTLSASPGASAATLGKLLSFSSPLLFWSIAGSATQTLFDGMTLQQKQRAAEANLDKAAALYRNAVITSFQNVADVLQAIQADQKLAAAAAKGAQAALSNLDLTRQLFKAGEATMLQLLNAEQSTAQARMSLAQAREAQLGDVVMLFQALGGGWREPERVPKAVVRS